MKTVPGGFTLVELVLVCVVIAVLLAGTAPRFSQTADRLRAERSVFELTQLLRYAHARAVAEGLTARWSWDADAHQARIELLGGLQADPNDTDAALPRSAPLPEEATVTVARDGQPVDCACVQFFPDGTADPAVVAVDAATASYTITIHAATGHVLFTQGTAAH